MNNIPLKGEIVIIIEGFNKQNELDIDTLRMNIKKKFKDFSLRDTVNLIISETNFSRKLIYDEAVKIKEFITEK